jgi:predicted ArsR family transcriptional regulator
MTVLQQQARALGNATRHDIFQYVMAAPEPVDVAALTAHFGLNHNAIRQHLLILVNAGLVLEAKANTASRGRPRYVYEVSTGVESQWGAQGPYERLSHWMSEIIRTGDSAVDVGRRIGNARPVGAGSSEPVYELFDHMERDGFDPVIRQTGKRLEITLQTCPFASTALADPDTVCDLHLGIALGIADNLDGVVVDELVANDPRKANCKLRCRTEHHT